MDRKRTHWEVRVTCDLHRGAPTRDPAIVFEDEANARLEAIRLALLSKGVNVRRRTVEMVKVETHEDLPEVFDAARAAKALMGA